MEELLLTAPVKEPSEGPVLEADPSGGLVLETDSSEGLVPEAEPPLEKEEESSTTTPSEKGVPKLSDKEALTAALEEVKRDAYNQLGLDEFGHSPKLRQPRSSDFYFLSEKDRALARGEIYK